MKNWARIIKIKTLRTSIHSTKKKLLIFSKQTNKPNNLKFQNFLNWFKKTLQSIRKKIAKKKKNTNKFDLKNLQR